MVNKMSIVTELDCIYTDTPVILNLGLETSKQLGIKKLCDPVSLLDYVQHLNEIMHVGWSGTVYLKTESREATLVVSGEFNHEARDTDLLWSMVEATKQDCIAIYYPEQDFGTLFGPRADSWGEFDLNFFVKGEHDDCI